MVDLIQFHSFHFKERLCKCPADEWFCKNETSRFQFLFTLSLLLDFTSKRKLLSIAVPLAYTPSYGSPLVSQ